MRRISIVIFGGEIDVDFREKRKGVTGRGLDPCGLLLLHSEAVTKWPLVGAVALWKCTLASETCTFGFSLLGREEWSECKRSLLKASPATYSVFTFCASFHFPLSIAFVLFEPCVKGPLGESDPKETASVDSNLAFLASLQKVARCCWDSQDLERSIDRTTLIITNM